MSNRRALTTSSQTSGFTLIELMIAVAVVGILAAIAYPSYQEQVRQSRRADATAVLVEAAQFMERFYTLNNRYDETRDGTAVSLPANLQRAPKEGTNIYYDVTLSTVAQNSFTLLATPVNAQAGDACGNLTLTNTGARAKTGTLALERCWR